MSVRQLMEAEAARLAPGQVDLWPRIQAGLMAERRRARQRRLVVTSAGAALLLFGWLGVAPVGGWLPGAANTVVPTAQAAEMTPGPVATAVPYVLAMTAPTPTATTTTTPAAGR